MTNMGIGIVRRILAVIAVVLGVGLPFSAEALNKCPKCGKAIISGSSHICKSRNNSRSYNNDSKKADVSSEVSDANTPDLPQMQYCYSDYVVIGLVIDPTKEQPQLLCKGKTWGERSLDITASDVKEYYAKYKPFIPVLGIQGTKKDQEDETLIAALEQLKNAQKEARKQVKAMRESENKGFNEFKTPFRCLAGKASINEDSKLIRDWTNKKGQKLRGVWVGNYSAHNVDGIVILGVKKKRLTKIPVVNLSEADVEFLENTKKNDPVTRYTLVTIKVEANTPLGERFSRLGVSDSNIEAIVFGKRIVAGSFYEKIEAYYLQLFPEGQICELTPEELGVIRKKDLNLDEYHHRDVWNSIFDNISYISKMPVEVASKGSVVALEARYAYGPQGERELLIAYYKAQEALRQAHNREDLWNPAKDCPVHKWSPEFAPRFGGDYQTEQTKNAYARNLIEALRAMKEGALKCTCYDEAKRSKYYAAKKDAEDSFAIMTKLEKDHPEIDFIKAKDVAISMGL